MATIRGPLMSLAASGTIGKVLTFGSWKGRAVVRERIVPSNPRSAGQVGRRSMFSFLTQAWDAIPAGPKATWQEIATALSASTFNAYLSINQERWHNFLTPGSSHPVPGGNNGSDRALSAAAWEENRIKLSSTATTNNQQWGIVYFAKLAGAVTPGVGSAIIVELDEDTANRDTFWTPPSPGRWYFNSITFSYSGVQEAAGGGVDTGP